MAWTLRTPGAQTGSEDKIVELGTTPFKLIAANSIYLAPLCFAVIPHDVYIQVDKLDLDPDTDGWPWIVRRDGVFLDRCVLVDSGPICMDIPDITVFKVRVTSSIFYLSNSPSKIAKGQSVSSIVLVKGHRFPGR